MRSGFIYLLFFILTLSASAQKLAISPTVDPEFFAANDEITITYDVSFQSPSSWSEAWLWAWLPTNTSINPPSNVNPASSNASITNAAKFTKRSEGGRVYFDITITPSTFFNTSKDNITSIGFLLKGDDWADGQTEDYVTEVTDGFVIKFIEPEGNFKFYTSGFEIPITVKTSESSTITLYHDDVAQGSPANNATELTSSYIVADDDDVHVLKAVANNGIESVETTFSYAVSPTPPSNPLPAGVQDGINYIDDNTVTLVLTAPNKENVFVIGDFNDWTLDNDYLMNKDGEQFWLTVGGLTKGDNYRFQYLIDGEIRIADPYSEKIGSPFDDPEIIAQNRYPDLENYPNDKTSDAVTYIQTGQTAYSWEVVNFERPAKEDLMIYELLVRDFTDQRDYESVISRLDYLKSLGINAIELLPITEFEGNNSWGYNPSFMLATDKYYGTEDQLKKLIDESHKRGIAVIADIVLNHAFGRSPLVRMENSGGYNAPTNDNVYLNKTAKHDFNVGYDFNHESEYTKTYLDRVNEFWLQEYKFDGFRFDLSKGFTQKNTLGSVDAWSAYDASRIALLKRMADHIWSIDEDAYVILEHLAVNQEETELSNYGMMLWGNRNPEYRSLAKGNSRSLDNVFHEGMGWDDPHLVAYMESHDEERVMWDLMKTNTRTLSESVARCQLNAAFFFTIPGPKMIWQFGEMGYDEELNDDRLAIKPTHWEYLEQEKRAKLVDVYTSLMNLKTKTEYIDSRYYDMKSSGGVKWITIDHPDVTITVVGNFNKTSQSVKVGLTQNGTWYNYLTEEVISVSDYQNYQEVLSAGAFRIYTTKKLENYIDGDPTVLFVNSDELSENIVLVVPNPADSWITLSSDLPIKAYEIYDVSGKAVHNETTHMDDNRVYVGGLSDGVYLIKVWVNDEYLSLRWVKR
ncbi:alpha-amylase family glycosyl hydrolase [Reichenbachiella versicolor]|uniref:alpha-amylase family glycosyl hydrolase n=1 Tax=Reichenbachiella versicolor TaxID=1821036 RepID=UPI000D6E742D|nr:alpha-amylase family glycosyl hydrolase [Reichenbachiella versicolor]